MQILRCNCKLVKAPKLYNFFTLNSIKHFNLSKKKDYIFRDLKHLDVIFIILINVKMPTIVL